VKGRKRRKGKKAKKERAINKTSGPTGSSALLMLKELTGAADEIVGAVKEVCLQ
jgi:hypothetical protein